MSLHVIRASRSHRRRIGAAAAVSNGLLNNLIAYWPGDEASGNLLDAHSNGLDLTDILTVSNNTGLVYGLARQYTAANLEYHMRPGDDALLSVGDVDFTFATWIYLNSKSADRTIIGKWSAAAGNREYLVNYDNSSDRFSFVISNDGTASTQEDADNLGSPALSTWYLIIAWHDPVANTINIQVSNGIVDSQNYALGANDFGSRFAISSRRGNGPDLVWDGRIGPTAMWKSAAGAGGVLTAAKRTALYNGGAGLPYASFTM